MDLQLDGKAAIVTGGSRGIGKAVARQLLEEGAAVVLAARDEDVLASAAAELGSIGPPVVAVATDTSDDASVDRLVRRAADRLGGVDILVNAAARSGGQPTGSLGDIDLGEFLYDIDVKLLGYLRCARGVALLMVERGWGRIINIGGLAARQSASVVASARNSAVAALTKHLADTFGRSGINVTTVHPGTTRTERTVGVLTARAAARGVTAEDLERSMASQVAIGRLVDASEVAAVVAFLASPRSVAITGDVIACGGGQVGPIYF